MAVQIVIGTEQFGGNPANHSFSCKAPEGWRSPGRCAYFSNHRVTHSVLECGGPPPLFHGAISNDINVNWNCYSDQRAMQSAPSLMFCKNRRDKRNGTFNFP
jgi:hypothetical protein